MEKRKYQKLAEEPGSCSCVTNTIISDAYPYE
jgi:hypothetical protein